MKNKNGFFKFVGLLACVGLLTAGSTYAYFTHAQKINNQFTVGENTISIEEEFEPPKEMTQGENVYKKKVQIKNESNVPCYVRVFAEFSDGDIKAISQLDNGAGFVNAADYPDNLPENWVYISEADDTLLGGYYYYTVPLEVGAKTIPLFERVKTTFAAAEDVKAYELIVYAESVQTLDKNGEDFTGAEPWNQAWDEFINRK